MSVIQRRRYATQSITVAPSDEVRIGGVGTNVRCLSASQAAFQIAIDDGPFGSFAQGLALGLDEALSFQQIRIRNVSAADSLQVEIAIGAGLISDSRFTLKPAGGIVSVVDVSVAAGAVVQVLAANANRRVAILTNPVGNLREFRIGDSVVGAARGIILPPGDRIEFPVTGSVWAYNPDVAIMTISLAETE